MNWEQDISNTTKETMMFLGDFSPTVRKDDRLVKGYMLDEDGGGKVYLSSGDLREIAKSCIEVANWLDKRAEVNEN